MLHGNPISAKEALLTGIVDRVTEDNHLIKDALIFAKEVIPHVNDAWINADKRDEKDEEIGIVGYEIPFNRHFYVYQPPRALVDIDSDLDAVSSDIMKLLQEVHS